MRTIGLLTATFLLCVPLSAQSILDAVYNSDRALARAVADRGVGPAFLDFLAKDAVIFRPEAVNGPEFLKTNGDEMPGALIRRVNFADVASNGLLGYTTGEWTSTKKEKTGQVQRIGQYATVWQKQPDGKFKAILDIEISHEPYKKKKRGQALMTSFSREANKQGWSAADAIMNFLKMSMTKKGLGGAYDKFAAEDVRLFREGLPPIEGRGDAEEVLEKYIAVDFPQKVSQFESADMAYSWNSCSYADSNEGMEKGNCLHVWKLQDKEWKIVLGVFARVANETLPVLKEKNRANRRRQ